ncbi:hypothetical protein CBR_g59998 [Chara braunii]|uniref:Uncharacterized protein n=1 Tax=Chara braunii TaxID=69332 RepID=A0A388K8G2_CHABU|nr:hypothetical protein CBR_g59998 [Chara braunii]|eukprot:GBG66347.1 hypothetical protein CBR_g59998 [Chara braunii]
MTTAGVGTVAEVWRNQKRGGLTVTTTAGSLGPSPLRLSMTARGRTGSRKTRRCLLTFGSFQGYGVKAFSMKAFDVCRNRTEFRMLDLEKFLSKTNGYLVTRSLPVVDNTFLLSRPLVQFNSPTDQLPVVVMRFREQFVRLPAAQQVDCVFVPMDAGSKRRQDPPARAGAKRKQSATVLLSSDAVGQALPAPVSPSDRQGRDAAEQSSETTDYDDGALRHLASPQHRSRGDTGAFDEEECEGQEGEGGGEEGDGGNEGDAEGEDKDMDEERDVGEDDAYGVGDADDADGARMSQLYNQAKDGTDKHGSRGKRKRGDVLTSTASQTKQARTHAVNEARGALKASQEAQAPRKIGGGGEVAVVAAVGKARRGPEHKNCGTLGMRARGWGLACPRMLTSWFSAPRPLTQHDVSFSNTTSKASPDKTSMLLTSTSQESNAFPVGGSFITTAPCPTTL